MWSFFTEQGARLEQITTASGVVGVTTFPWRFQRWRGVPIADTYGGKAVLDCEGIPCLAELALIPVLKQHGFEGAVWVDGYRRCFRDAMPPAICDLPAMARMLHDRIATTNDSRGGCWDVLAWNRDGIAFVECKRKGKDRMRANGVKWLESGLKTGIPLERFAICEWELAE